LLRVQEISVTLGNFMLKNITLHVKGGEYMVLLGPTGTGKTVLLETIVGMHAVESGKIFIHGKDATRLPPEKRNLGVVYQDYALFPHLTVRKNIAFGLRLRGNTREETTRKVEEMADFLDIGQILERRTVNLSGGEGQRVALARALVLKPYVLLLDEPLSALDRTSRDRLRRELKRIHKEMGITILHITHDLTEAFFLASHLAVMKDGRILQQGSPGAVLRAPKNRTVAELLGVENLIKAEAAGERGFLTSLGPLDMEGAFPGKPEYAADVYLTIPGWCVEVVPQRETKQYAWMGKMRVEGTNFLDGLMELELTHTGGERLRTSLSRREISLLDIPLEIGAQLPVGLLKEGIYWVPRFNS